MTASPFGPGGARLEPRAFSTLPGWAVDDHAAAFAAFRRSATHHVNAEPALRQGLAPDPALIAAFTAALAWAGTPKAFFETQFTPFAIRPETGAGFLTGYYEPELSGSLIPHPDYPVPVLARPSGLVTVPQGGMPPAPLDPSLQSYRVTPQGPAAAPDRADIEDGAFAGQGLEIAWLRDRVDLFFMHVQGSARLKLPDGGTARLVYAGRNGHPYTSIGRVIVEEGHLPLEQATLAPLKDWLRRHPAEARRIMRLNRSYIFFSVDKTLAPEDGPIGAAGHPLIPLRSIAVDRTLWPYGTPFFITADGDLPSNRLWIAQDTGSAIVGPARADLFFGAGEVAGLQAGAVRHRAEMIVLLPRTL